MYDVFRYADVCAETSDPFPVWDGDHGGRKALEVKFGHDMGSSPMRPTELVN